MALAPRTVQNNYALLADAYPKGGTPQLLSKIFTTAGYKCPTV
jgi:hypothetical protein